MVDAGHADEDDRDVFSIMSVTKDLEGGRGESFGFIDDEEFYPSPGIMAHDGSCPFADRSKVFVDAVPQSPLDAIDVVEELGGFGENGRGEEQGAGSVSCRVVFRIGRVSRSPFGDERFKGVPPGVAASGLGLPTPASPWQIPMVRSFLTALANSVNRRCSFVMMKSRLMIRPLRMSVASLASLGRIVAWFFAGGCAGYAVVDVFTEGASAGATGCFDVSEAESLVRVRFVDGDTNEGVVVIDTNFGKVPRVVSDGDAAPDERG